MKTTSLFSLAMALGAQAIGTLNYTDATTGISFSGYTNGKGFSFGMALPETPEKDAVMQLVGPLTDGGGWASFDFGVSMRNKLLIVAWPNGKDVVLSPRIATGYTNPTVYTKNDIKLSPIPKGTFVNSTHYSATFLCGGCITGDEDTFKPTDETGVFAYAVANTAVATPADPASALTFHSSFSGFGMSLADAKSADYAKWADMADTTTTPKKPSVPSGGSNATIPVTTSNSTYDYIVAGGGAAGLVVASRLAESGASVLMVERGGPSSFSSGGKAVMPWNSSVTQYDVPAMAYYLSSSGLDPTAYCDDTASMSGCLLGGGTMINAMMFVPPQDADFDDKWPKGWKSADVKAASERFFKEEPGTELPSMDGKRYDQGAYDALSSFLSSNGFSSVSALGEPNKKVDVFSHPPMLISNGQRSGPVKTYLPKAQSSKNFHMSLNTKVVRAVRDGSFASGIEVEKADGSHEIINVTPKSGKVILAAGALSTPRILMYSGIGPEAEIKKVPSTVKVPSPHINLPVGKGIMDHTILTITLGTKQSLPAINSTEFTSPSEQAVQLFGEGSGLLSQSGQRINFWTSVKSPSDGKERFMQGTCNSPKADEVKIKLYLTHGTTSSANVVLDTTGKQTELEGKPWLQTDGDIEAYHVMLDRIIAMTQKDNSTMTLKMSDGSAAPAGLTGADLFEDAKASQVTGSHWVGSARMGLDDGRKENGNAVVDTDTKVYGTDNLFVVDASMHADLPTGNTQAIVMVAAEQAASKILALGGQDGGAAEPSQPAQPNPDKCKKRKKRAAKCQQKKRSTVPGVQLSRRAYAPGFARRATDHKLSF